MSGGDWSAIDLTQDPVRGEPTEVRALASAAQQEAGRWEEWSQALRTIAQEGSAMQMEGDFAPRFRESVQAHPEAATRLARGRRDAAQALVAYASALEQAKRTSQMALSQGAQARQAHRAAKQAYEQAVAQLNSLPRVVPPQQYPYVMQQYNMLRAQAQRAWQAMQQAEMQWKAARQRAVQAGEQAAQQERVAAERVLAAVPTTAAASGGRANGGGSGSGSGSGPSAGGASGAGAAAARPRRTANGEPTAAPARDPSPDHRAGGTPEAIRGKPSPQMREDVDAQNRNADVLARKGYDVRHQPKERPPHIDRDGVETTADYKIGDRYYEHKVPHTGNVRNFVDNNLEKGATEFRRDGTQAERFVVDLSNGKITPEQLRAEIMARATSEQGTGVQEVIVIQNGNVIPIYP
jgi:hypothetical protein